MEESGSFHGGDQGLRDELEGCGMEMLRQENLNLSLGNDVREKYRAKLSRFMPRRLVVEEKGVSHLYVDNDVMGYKQNKSFHRESNIIFVKLQT